VRSQRHVAAIPEEAAIACAKHIAVKLNEALSGEPIATLAISGGSTPAVMLGRLARRDIDWRRVHLFWVDERAVAPEDVQSNYGMAFENLIAPAKIPASNVHRIRGELGANAASEVYEHDLRTFFDCPAGEIPHFDVIQCGIGADAHTASLFPGEPLIDDRGGIAAAIFAEPAKQWRVTLLPGVLLAARHTVILVTGSDKAEALRQVWEGPYNPMECPAQLLSHHARSADWFLDSSAASKLD